MDSLKYIKDRFKVDLDQEPPIRLPINRFGGLTSVFRGLGVKIGAEIGVSRGRYSKWLVMRAKPKKLFLVDPFMAYDEYVEHHGAAGQKNLDNNYKKAQQRVAKFDECEFVRKTSIEALKDFNDNSLDFVFIDGNHTFEYVVCDIAGWSEKVKPGGIISGHDYWRSSEVNGPLYKTSLNPLERIKLVQVKDAVNGWTKANRIKPWFVTEDNTWLWVKQ